MWVAGVKQYRMPVIVIVAMVAAALGLSGTRAETASKTSEVNFSDRLRRRGADACLT